MNEKLINKLKKLINEKNISVQGLEKKAGLKVSAVRNILIGNSKRPSAETLLAIAKALNCSISDLLDENISKQSKISNLKFSNYELFEKTMNYIIRSYIENKLDIESHDLISLAQEIYAYSCDNNNSKFDEQFSKWLLSKHLKSSTKQTQY